MNRTILEALNPKTFQLIWKERDSKRDYRMHWNEVFLLNVEGNLEIGFACL